MYTYVCICPSLPAALLENKPLKVTVDFSLEQPKGGVQFVIPPGTTTDSQVFQRREGGREGGGGEGEGGREG